MEEITKSYTDLEQSKKLSKILSYKTADMCHKCIGDESYDTIVRPYSEYHEKYRLLIISKDFNAVPCWSLTALLCVLQGATLDISEDKHFRIHYNKMFSDWHDNPIDSCIEIIHRVYNK